MTNTMPHCHMTRVPTPDNDDTLLLLYMVALLVRSSGLSVSKGSVSDFCAMTVDVKEKKQK